MDTLSYTGTLTIVNCGVCHIEFAMPEQLYRWTKQRPADRPFWCPVGHQLWWNGKSEAQELREKLEQEQRRVIAERAAADRARAEADHQAARANGYKGQLAKTKKRIARGVCPCCNRTFVDVQRHMASKHPEVLG